MQVEKHLQLDLDEASQDVLEALQAQMNALEATQSGFPTLIHQHLEDVQAILHEQNTAEHYVSVQYIHSKALLPLSHRIAVGMAGDQSARGADAGRARRVNR